MCQWARQAPDTSQGQARAERFHFVHAVPRTYCLCAFKEVKRISLRGVSRVRDGVGLWCVARALYSVQLQATLSYFTTLYTLAIIIHQGNSERLDTVMTRNVMKEAHPFRSR